MSAREMTVFLLRNSDPSQDMSLASQREDCERFAHERGLSVLRQVKGVPSGAFLHGAFVDDSVSGAATDERRGFQAMMKACLDPKSRIRYVVCYDVFRFGRFDADEAGYHRHILKQAGVEIQYAAEGFRGDESDELVRGVKQWLGHKYLVDLSQATQGGDIQVARLGFWLGGLPPHGFDLRYEDASGQVLFIVRFEPDGSKTVLNLDGTVQRRIPRGERILRGSSNRARLYLSAPSRVDLVIVIFEMYATGIGYKRIAKILNGRGIPAPRNGNWSKRHKRGWSHGTIRNIIENPAYLGRLVYNRTSLSKFHRIRQGDNGPVSVRIPPVRATKVAKLPEKDWIVTEVKHPAIISAKLWDRAQAARRDRRKPHARGSPSEYIFSGLMDCNACDHHYQGHTTTKGRPSNDGSTVKTRSYLCGGYDSKGTAICPTRWSVPEEVLWKSALAVIVNKYGGLFESPKFAEAVRERAVEILNRLAVRGPSVEDLRRRVVEIDELVANWASNLSPKNVAMLDKKLTEVREEKEALECQIAEQEDARPVRQPSTAAAIDRIGASLKDALGTIEVASPGLKRRFIRQFVERIELDPREKKGTAWIWRLPKSVLDSLGLSVSRIVGAGLEPATSGL